MSDLRFEMTAELRRLADLHATRAENLEDVAYHDADAEWQLAGIYSDAANALDREE